MVEVIFWLQAAVLHDTVEDTQTTFDELEKLFGEEVRSLVDEVSDDKSLPKQERKRLQVRNTCVTFITTSKLGLCIIQCIV